MRTLGLIGGMSWVSTAHYYRALNEGVAARRGGLHSAPLLLHSLDFAPIAAAQAAGDWDALAAQLGASARALAGAGAQGLLLATNTMHRVAEAVQAAAGPDVPLLHIADATGAALQAAGVGRAALLGTRFTMEDGAIVADRLRQRFGLEVRVPEADERALVHRVIYEELCHDRAVPASRAAYLALIGGMKERGAEAVILGCTEIGMLVDASNSPLPVFDSTALHAAAALDWMLDDPP